MESSPQHDDAYVAARLLPLCILMKQSRIYNEEEAHRQLYRGRFAALSGVGFFMGFGALLNAQRPTPLKFFVGLASIFPIIYLKGIERTAFRDHDKFFANATFSRNIERDTFNLASKLPIIDRKCMQRHVEHLDKLRILARLFYYKGLEEVAFSDGDLSELRGLSDAYAKIGASRSKEYVDGVISRYSPPADM